MWHMTLFHGSRKSNSEFQASFAANLEMCEFDVTAAKLMTNAILPILLVLLVFLFFAKNVKSLRQRLFAHQFVGFVREYNRDLDAAKTELFAELQDFKSLDWNLRNKGLIRILEIGVGPGSNFKFYPKNARLVAVDPNPHFRQYLEENASKFPQVTLEQIVLGEGEDLAEVKDGSVDVVITTMVLCSVRDVEKVLNEIKRVLAQGGKFFFLEHIIGGQGSSYRRLQTLLNPIWSYLYDGCNVTRDIGRMIDQAGFSKTTINHFIAPLNSMIKHVIGPHIAGNAQK